MGLLTSILNLFKTKKVFQEYGFQIKDFQLSEGIIRYAQWKHPNESPKSITESSINFYNQFSKKGDLIIDIGAHTGDTTVPMAVSVGREGMVIALEPNPYVFKILEENSKLNSEKTNIKPYNFAATAEDGTFTFNYSDPSFCNGGFFDQIKSKNHHHNYPLQVRGINLSKFLKDKYLNELERLSLIKVDAEGYDKEILKTISDIISQYKPFIIAECNKNLVREERLDLYNVLENLNYLVYMTSDFETGERVLIENAEDMCKWKHFDIICVPKL